MNRVLRVETDRFTVGSAQGHIVCPARKKHKKNSILVGDLVDLDTTDGIVSVGKVYERKNRLIRPSVANVDQIVMILAPVPEPDFSLADKMIVNCIRQKISCVICVNKTDLDDSFAKQVEFQYGENATVVSACAARGDVEELRTALKGKFSCLAGQSAVGKSSLVNALVGEEKAKSGEMSGNNRGKNTTTAVTVYDMGEDTYLADSPGFGLLDVFDVPYDELDLYYAEYVACLPDCKYPRCIHIEEPCCEVKRRVAEGSLHKGRYERYVKLYKELKSLKRN